MARAARPTCSWALRTTGAGIRLLRADAADLAKTWDENLPKYMVPVGIGRARATGSRSSTCNSAADVHQRRHVQKRRPGSGQSPKTRNDWLAAMKKLTIARSKEVADSVVFAIRSKGHPVGITDKFCRSHTPRRANAEPGKTKLGLCDQPPDGGRDAFLRRPGQQGQGREPHHSAIPKMVRPERAAVIFRESWFYGWLKKNAPDVNFKVVALPCEKACPGAGALFPWTDLVYKNSPNKQVAWEFMRFISNAKDDMDHHQSQGILPVWTANLDTAYVKARPDYQSTKTCSPRRSRPTYIPPKANEFGHAFGDAVVGVVYGKGSAEGLE